MKQPIIIDTREPFEFQASHAEDAINISPAQFMNGEFRDVLSGVALDDPIVVYCRTGVRSNTCAMILRDTGFTNISNGVNEHRAAKLASDMRAGQ